MNNTNLVPMEDIQFFLQQSKGNMNMILSGMTAIMNDTDTKVSKMENQGWFKRMWKTVTGQNKATKELIKQNHDKLNAYMSQAIAELYNRNSIDEQVMISLGTQLNELYEEHLQLKQMLGAFVTKLNEKIDSVDNFHMLIEEINQGVFSQEKRIIGICKVMAQFDNRIMEEERKLNIIKTGLKNKNIITDEEFLLTNYLKDILELPLEEAGRIYLELGTIRNDFLANLILEIIEDYHFLPDMRRKFMKKDVLVNNLIEREGIDKTITLTLNEVYDNFINSKIEVKNQLVPVNTGESIGYKENGNVIDDDTEIIENNDSEIKKAEQLFLEGKWKEAFKIFEKLAENGNRRAMYFMGQYYQFSYSCVIIDKKKANEWRKKGYEKGEELSTLRYGFNLSDEEEKNRITSQVFPKVLKLAENGDTHAQFELGRCYEWGTGVEKNGKEAFKWYMKSAEKGHSGAQNNLGLCYANGIGAGKDESEAFKWYKKSAEQGNSDAQNNLGLCYENGIGAGKDESEAFKWYKKSAEQGNVTAQYNLGLCYGYGIGVKKDESEAFRWYKKSAEQCNSHARCNVGYCYENGIGVEKDESEAFKWYKKSAEQGNVTAQYNVGCCYENGIGVERDEVEAFKWYMKSAEQGYTIAKKNVIRCYENGIGVTKNLLQASLWDYK